MDAAELWEALRSAWLGLVRAATGGIAPPRQALGELVEWVLQDDAQGIRFS